MKHLLALLLVGCGGSDFTAERAPFVVEQDAGSGGAPAVVRLEPAAGGAVPIGAGGVPGTGGTLVGTGGAPALQPCKTGNDCPTGYCAQFDGTRQTSQYDDCRPELPWFCGMPVNGRPCI